jgi:hypothetical protein
MRNIGRRDFIKTAGVATGNYFIVGEIDSSAATDMLNLYVFAKGDAIHIGGDPDATLALAVDITAFNNLS